MELHHSLIRLLNRLSLKPEEIPSSLEQWQEVLGRFHRMYQDADQDKAMLEHSMEISTREMLELNARLELAQHISRSGHWYLDTETGKFTWSKSLYLLLGCNPTEPDHDCFFKDRVHKNDLTILEDCIKKAKTDGKDYECETRLLNKQTGSYLWCRIIIHPHMIPGKQTTLVSGIAMDITKSKLAQEELEALHTQLLNTARRAGMSEVAISILHNVGNILNSTSVSLGLINEKVNNDDIKNLKNALALLNEHQHEFEYYLKNDEKGKLLPEYLNLLARKIDGEFIDIKKEMVNLCKQFEHIKEIVSLQKSLSGSSSVEEKISIPEMIDLAIQMSGDLEKSKCQVEMKYNEIASFMADKHKLLQILINLIQNAKDSLKSDLNNLDKKITIYTRQLNNMIELKVQDNGVGITEENLSKIFAFGFTTKTNGHGFGLHSSALMAKELGGKLEVDSKGYNQGATFTLTIPIKTAVFKRDPYERKTTATTNKSD